ncbi:hypothetical protein [Pontiella sp.]|uniref:hypothetical protein n=1 Tax=Pontiella sp. TaxID=2837462 RepID=UPI0035665F30
MKPLLAILLFIAADVFACGPWFPSSYLSDLDSHFIENINVSKELELIAIEYGLIENDAHPKGWSTTIEAERADFSEKATRMGGVDLTGDYQTFAKAVRAGDTNAIAPSVPEHLGEFVLYLEGMREFMADANVVRPQAWDALLALDVSNRLYRTPWVHYMLGNLAGSHGHLDDASKHYEACRATAHAMQTDRALGLAHASFKRDYLCQTNLTRRIERGIAAVGYYNLAWDRDREKFCMEHLQLDFRQAAKDGLENPGMAVLEAMALFNVGKQSFIRELAAIPELKITPRLAWFMYKNGETEKAEAYLEHCAADDILANWLRYRIAQRAGRTDAAIAHLRKWLHRLTQSDRLVYQLGYRAEVSPKSAVHGSMGTLLASQGQMMDALDSFVRAGAYLDAALIAERYVETDELKRYVDALECRVPYHRLAEFDEERVRTETWTGVVELRLSWLLARRLFREGRAEDARPYYPPEIADLLNHFLAAKKTAANIWANRETRAANLYHAARIMRWKGMELCGTELYPDQTVVSGNFPWSGVSNESAIGPTENPPIYAATAPIPNVRFHYRNIAAELAGEAARLSWNPHRKAMMRWSAGMWIMNRHPVEADVHYKKLAKIRFQPLAKAADQKRWFPESTPLMDYVHRSEDYIEPKLIAKAAREYGK